MAWILKIYRFMETDFNIELRRIEREDLALLWKWNLNKELGELQAFTNNKSLAEFQREYEKKLGDNSALYYLILVSDSKEPIGFCGVKSISWIDRNAEIFISICDKDYWKNGFATLALMMVVKIAFFELNLNKIYAKISGNNERILGFMKKWGFQPEGVMKEMHYSNNKFHDVHIYGVLKRDVEKLLEFGIKQVMEYLLPKTGKTTEKDITKSRQLIERVAGAI